MIPEVVAYPLDEARRLLAAAGVEVRVAETHPPGRGVPAGSVRVLRQRNGDGTVQLIVAHERYERPTSAPPSP